MIAMSLQSIVLKGFSKTDNGKMPTDAKAGFGDLLDMKKPKKMDDDAPLADIGTAAPAQSMIAQPTVIADFFNKAALEAPKREASDTELAEPLDVDVAEQIEPSGKVNVAADRAPDEPKSDPKNDVKTDTSPNRTEDQPDFPVTGRLPEPEPEAEPDTKARAAEPARSEMAPPAPVVAEKPSQARENHVADAPRKPDSADSVARLMPQNADRGADDGQSRHEGPPQQGNRGAVQSNLSTEREPLKMTVVSNQTTPAPAQPTLAPVASMQQPVTAIIATPATQIVDAISEKSDIRPSAPVTQATQRAEMTNSVQTLKIQLQPLDLGSVTAKLTVSGERLVVELQVETSEAHHKLSSDSDAIVKSLRGLGFDIDRVTISQTQPAAQTGNGAADNRNPASTGFDGRSENQSGRQGNDGRQAGNGADNGPSYADGTDAAPDRSGVYI